MKNVRKYIALIFVIFILVIIQSGEFKTVAILGRDRPIRLVHIFLPIPAFLSFFLIGKKIQISKHSIVFISLNIFLVGSIFLTEFPSLNLTILDHFLAVTTIIVLAILVNRYNINKKYIYIGFIIGSIPYLLLDIIAFLGLIPIGHGAPVVVPGTTYGGIGPDIGMGKHGKSISIAIISGLGLYTLSNKNQKRTKLYLGLVFVMLFVLLISQSRSSFMAFLIGISIVGFGYFYNKTKHIRTILVISLGFLMVLGMFLVIQNPRSLISRYDQIEAGLVVLQNHPLSGVGWNNFYPKYYSRHIIHFTPLNYFVFNGIVAGALFLAILVYPLLVAGKILFHNPYDFYMYFLLGFYVIAFVELLFSRATPDIHILVIAILLFEYINSS